jgi:carbonic anhydrase
LRDWNFGLVFFQKIRKVYNMDTLEELFDNDRRWAEKVRRERPGFFEKLAEGQSPEVLWIGCSDSRVPPNRILDLPPGQVFVHRNIGNLVVKDDPNGQSVIQYAVECLKVEHIIVCGHYDCGAVNAAMGGDCSGPIDIWLKPLRAIYHRHREPLDGISDPKERKDRLCELNTIAQVAQVCSSDAVTQAWETGQIFSVHGWMFNPADGLLHDLDITATGGK